MIDRYRQFATTGLGRTIVKQLGLPAPVELRRRREGKPEITGPVLVGGADGGRLGKQVSQLLADAGAELHTGLTEETRYGVLVYDATGIKQSSELTSVYDFFHPVFRSLLPSGRVIVLGTPPEDGDDPRESAAQRGLEGFVKSAGKEAGRGATANLVYVSPGAEEAIDSTLR
ncbi:MAG: 3-oxoacyl-ACP reductase, partial [Micromonosporaceae bacterium]